VVVWIAASAPALRISQWACLLALALMAADSFVHAATAVIQSGPPAQQGRLTGPMAHLTVGIYTAKMLFPCMASLLALAVASRQKEKLRLLLVLLGVFLLLVAVSGERTAMGTALVGLGGAGALLFWRVRGLRFAVVGLGMAYLVVLLAAMSMHPFVHERAQFLAAQVSDFRHSPYGQLFTAALRMGSDHWLTGVGMRNFQNACAPLMASGLVNYCDLHAHNPYLEWFAEAGLPGLLGLVAWVGVLLWVPLRAGLRAVETSEVTAAAFALGATLTSFFPFMASQSYFSNWPAILMWYSVALSHAALNLGAARTRQA
jgi:O-antigen ligase